MVRAAWLAATMALVPAAAWAEAAVDVELILAVDVSGSVDDLEARQQRMGYVDAFRDPMIIDAIAGNFRGRIAVAYVEWAGYFYQNTVVDWHVIEDKASAERFAWKLMDAPLGRERYTSISAAIDYAVPLFFDNGYAGDRLVLDMSGDGPNNRGRSVEAARDDALAKGIVINGLPIMNDRAQPWVLPTPMEFGLDEYYQRFVVGGPASFVVSATDFGDVGEAVRRKLVLEIAGVEPDAAAQNLEYIPFIKLEKSAGATPRTPRRKEVKIQGVSVLATRKPRMRFRTLGSFLLRTAERR